MRTIIFGDIHGCIEPFSQLLQLTAPDPQQDRIILLGDLVDRGPDPYAVWQTVVSLQRQFGRRLVLLRGNHEDYWLQTHPSFSQRRLHHRVGKATTVRSFR